MTEREIRAVVAVRRGAVRQTPEGLRCLPVEPTPAERRRVLDAVGCYLSGERGRGVTRASAICLRHGHDERPISDVRIVRGKPAVAWQCRVCGVRGFYWIAWWPMHRRKG